MVSRVNITENAKKLIDTLKEKYGELMFYQAGGCCEGTQPQCFKKGEYYLRYKDVCIGIIEDCEFWVDKDLFEYWKHAHFELDVIDAIGAGGFSLEVPLGKTFKVNYRIFSPDELELLQPVKFNL
ncbi:DUF779 domain-containing protein [Faecalibacter bovis]|uniref:DUF779 domain-containing protein n=1 Tax=Faecalibacter bovis TaxID=2898187 RepID=A0ABX7XFJ7_9FLAO|nr:DUF779 domain-containing protein [Faecalibacter bovis]MBS7334329.1 DUF779 domain-containing protein [Weeksellaceae bacterium]QTV06732.1 DUF779 domain-containing protein [Faecalibacter bovis]